MFVFLGWWYFVFNVKISVVVIQNFVSQENFLLVWVKICKEKLDLVEMWLKVFLKYG